MRLWLKYLFCSGFFLIPPVAVAQEYVEDDFISVYAQACEPVRTGETRSGARVRATDKASFKAVETIMALSDQKEKMLPNDFNVLVYNIIDNYLEDMAVRTLEQNERQICVEVTGYISPDNINKAENEQKEILVETDNQEEIDEVFLELEEGIEALPEPVTEMPPKPEPKIHEDIAFETQGDETDEGYTLVFVDKTKFYNGTESSGFFVNIQQALSENPNIKAVNTKTEADYNLKTTVLRAKIDPLNKQTSRLQMVVQLELTDTESGKIITEHQNRFILFESNKDEQIVAAELLQKLLYKGCRNLLPKIKVNGNINNSSAVITPPKSL